MNLLKRIQMSWNSLDNDQQRVFAKLCTTRRAAYEKWNKRGVLDSAKDILIIADRPGPKAPQTDNFHHTPFYSKIHSGGFINAQMVLAGITEDRLMWTNSATWDNKVGDVKLLAHREWSHVICLGGNAKKFALKNGIANPTVFDHPQYHKRFKSKEPYPFIEFVQNLG